MHPKEVTRKAPEVITNKEMEKRTDKSEIDRSSYCDANHSFPYFISIAFTFVLFVNCSSSDAVDPKSDPDPSQTGSSASAGVDQTGPSAGISANAASGQQQADAILSAGNSGIGPLDASQTASGGQGDQPAASGGVSGSAHPNAAGGMSGSAGEDGIAGTTIATGGQAGSDYTGGSGGSTVTEGDASRAPFGCDFAWGANDPGGSLTSLDYLHFITKWVGYEVDSNGVVSQCDGCLWLSDQVASTQLIPVFYAYFIGFFGKANGLPDGNEAPNAPNLTTHASALIKSRRSQIIQMYSQYAQQAYKEWTDKPLVWLLEGDFIQYTEDIQTDPLSMNELGQLAADITSAIKNNMPNAIVAVNHTTWNSNQETDAFWQSMQNASVAYDLVWTSGVANNNGYIESSGNSNSYNATSARYEYVHRLTGRNIFVDTSFGISAMADTWTAADATTLNARIAEGVIAANVVSIPGDYSSRVAALAPLLNSICD